jgi:TPP-dependent 2-oxoacid decarboxylase
MLTSTPLHSPSQLSLRYHLTFSSSRSSIGESAAQFEGVFTGSIVLPLYKKGVEKERFDRAILWLGRDILQILTYMGAEYEAKKNILYNVNKIFLCYSSCEKISF